MHAKAGADRGVLSHTISSRDYRDLRFNGVSVGETGINAALCGTWGCPVVLVTGDDVVCAEAVELLGPELVTATVKTALGRFSARNLPPARARVLIEAAAKEAVEKRDRIPPYDPGKPCEIVAVFATSDLVERYRHRHGVELLDPVTIASRADDWRTAWRQFFF
jgi:D-amino peptidase